MKRKGTKTLEQINRAKRQHPKMPTLSVEELKKQVQQLIDNPYSPSNLTMLFNSIKTLKAKEQLDLLLNHPRPDVNRIAHKLSKINCFKSKQQELNLQTNNFLEQQKILSKAAETNMYDILYQNAHKIDFEGMDLKRKLFPNKKFIKQKLEGLINEDLKIYQTNCIEVSQNKAEINTDVISRLRFGYQLFNYCKLDFIGLALPYLFDLYVFIIPERYTIKQKVDILKLEEGGQVSHKNFNKNKDNSVGYNLYQQDLLDQVVLFNVNQIPTLAEQQLQYQIKDLLSECGLIDHYELDKIDPEIIVQQQLQYYTYKHKMNYIDAVQFINKKQKEIEMLTSQKKGKEDHPEFTVDCLDINSISTIKVIRNFLEMNPEYVCMSQQPQHQLLQTKPPAKGSYFQKYSNIDENVEEVFEKHLLNNQARFLQSGKRFQALNSLILGALVHNKPHVIPKVVRYVVAAAEKTQNQRELTQLTEIVNPTRLFPLILNCIIEELIICQLPEFIAQVSKAYVTVPAIVQKMLPFFNDTLVYLVESIKDKGSNFDNAFHMAIEAASYIQYNIPLIKYKINNIYITVPTQAITMVTDDFARTFYQTEKGVVYENIVDKYKDVAKSEEEFYELIMEEISRPASYCYSYFNDIVEKLSKTQEHFLKLNSIVHKAKDSKDEAQIKKVQREYQYISAYKNIIQAIKFTVSCHHLADIQSANKKKLTTYNAYNKLIQKVNGDFNVLVSAISMLSTIVNQVFSQSINLNIVMIFNNNACSNVKITQWTLRCFEVLSNYINNQYQLYYDKNTLSSRFSVTNIINLHIDVLNLVSSSLREICQQANRFEKCKGVIEAFVKIQENLSLCQLDLANEYQQYYSNYSGFEGSKRRMRLKEQKNSKLYNQLKQFDVSFKLLAKSLCASDMLVIAGLLFKAKAFSVLISDVLVTIEQQIQMDKNVQFTHLLDQHIPMSALMSLIRVTLKSSCINQEQLKKLYEKGTVDVKICILQNYICQPSKQEDHIQNKLQFIKDNCLEHISVIKGALQNLYNENTHQDIIEQIIDILVPTLKEKKLSLEILQIFNICGYFKKKVIVYELDDILSMLKTQKLQSEMSLLYIVAYLFHSYENKSEQITEMLIDQFTQSVESQAHSVEIQNLYNSAVEYILARAKDQTQYKIQFNLYCKIVENLYGTNKSCLHEQFNILPQYMDAESTDRFISIICSNMYQYLSDQVAQQLYKLQNISPFTKAYLGITLDNGVERDVINAFSGSERAILSQYANCMGKTFIKEQ